MARAAPTSAVVQSKSATAGNSIGAKWPLVPSSRTAAVVTITSPGAINGWIAPVVPTRRNVRTPSWASSSTAIDVDGPPMPVEHTTIGTSPIHASHDVNSRWEASAVGSVHRRRDPLDPGRVAGHDGQGRAVQHVPAEPEVKHVCHVRHRTALGPPLRSVRAEHENASPTAHTSPSSDAGRVVNM